jgi:hypothetical protein
MEKTMEGNESRCIKYKQLPVAMSVSEERVLVNLKKELVEVKGEYNINR